MLEYPRTERYTHQNMSGSAAISLSAEPIFHIGSFPITNTLLLTWGVLIFFACVGFFLKNKWHLIPGKLQMAFEFITEEALKLMDSVLGERSLSEKYFPLVATIFFFILISNWMGIFPGLGSIGFFEHSGGQSTFIPFFRSPASDLNFTLALAIISVVMTNILAIQSLGFFAHVKKFLNFKSPIHFFVGILEFISEFAKVISFSFRLFGNVFAGEVLLIIIGVLVPYVIPMPFIFLEIFVGFIQSFIFAMLTLVFITTAISTHDDAHDKKVVEITTQHA